MAEVQHRPLKKIDEFCNLVIRKPTMVFNITELQNYKSFNFPIIQLIGSLGYTVYGRKVC